MPSPSPRRETTPNTSEGASLATPGNHPGFAEASSPPSSALVVKSHRFLNSVRKQIERQHELL